MLSCIHLLAATGDIFHPLLQVDTISTSDEPLPAIEASNALRMARLALLMAATVSTLCRLTKHVPSSCTARFVRSMG